MHLSNQNSQWYLNQIIHIKENGQTKTHQALPQLILGSVLDDHIHINIAKIIFSGHS